MSIKQSLIDEHKSQLEVISKMDVGTEAYKIAMDGITKLEDRINDIEKRESEERIKLESMEMEREFKTLQLEEEKRDRKNKSRIEVGKTLLQVGTTVGCFFLAMNFEKTGHLFGSEGAKATVRSLLKFGK